MSKITYFQNAVLNKLRRERREVTLITINGFQMRGRITAFDQFIIVMEIENKQQIIYKHAISTITPNQPVSLDGLTEEDQSCLAR